MRNRVLAALSGCALLLGMGDVGVARPLPDAAASPSAGGVMAHVQIMERLDRRVHVLRQAEPTFAGVIGNVLIIEQSDGVVLIDSGSSYGVGQRVVEWVKSLTTLPVKAVILTHWHNDHPLGLSAIKAAWPDAKVIATAKTKLDMETGALGDVPRAPSAEYEAKREKTLREAGARYETRAADQARSPQERANWAIAAQAALTRIPDIKGTYMVLPDITFTDNYRLDDTVAPIEIAYLGWANTDGDAVVWLPRQRVLAAGDAVVEPIPYMFSIRPTQMEAVLKRIDRYRYRVMVPGHGVPQRNHAYLARLMTLTDEVQRQVDPIARGLTLEEVTARTDFSAQRKIFAGDDKWLAYWFDQYALEPLIASVYREARGEPPPE